MTNVYGDDNPNTLKGTAGADELYGGAGNDFGIGNYVGVAAGSGDGSAANPYADLTGDEPSGNDMLDGGTGSDVLYGLDGDDVIHGGEGDDGGAALLGVSYFVAGLFGGDGDDALYGGGGDDEITGGEGQDDMFGGQGEDTFFFASVEEIGKGSTSDRLGDFSFKQGDVIDLALIDAKEGGGDSKFKYIGDDAFSDTKGELQFKNGKLKGDTDGDGRADFVMIINTNKITDDDAFNL